MNQVNLQGITRTMIWTLRPRAEEYNSHGSLFEDRMACEWFGRITYQPDMESWYTPAFQTTIAIRTRMIDDITREFAGSHDAPLVVELGAGLTTRPYRLDLPKARWIMLDLPEAIAFRSQFEKRAANIDVIACSVLDFQWLEQIPEVAPENILFIAEGLFMFLSPNECRALVQHMREQFAGSTLLLDISGQTASTGEARVAQEMGVPLRWMVHDEYDVAALGLRLVRVWPFFQQHLDRLRHVLGEELTAPGARNASLLIEAVIPPLFELASVRHLEADGKPDMSANHPESIIFRGRRFAARKQFLYGQQRLCSPEQTLQHIQPYIEMARITRVADITGLDRVGIPVTLVTRPNAPTLSNSTGKGFSLEAAKVSGIMESIEVYLAEIVRPEELYMPYTEIVKQRAVIPEAYLPLMRHSVFHIQQPERWTMGWDLVAQQEVAVPVQLVMLHSMKEVLGSTTNFQMGSNGLASGNHFLEALASALYELIERDAVTTRTFVWRACRLPPHKIRLGSIQSPLVRDLLDRFQAAAIDVIVFDMTGDLGIPTYQAIIYDKRARGTGIAGGQGAHLDPGIALIRALTEAAQSRVIGIAGSRDEHFQRHAMLFKTSDSTSRIRDLEAIPETVEGERQATIHQTFEEDIWLILERFRRAGLNQVIVFELSQPDQQICAVRVIVPGLEGYMYNYYTAGPRARAAVKQYRT